MSHYTEIRTNLLDEEALVKSLHDLGRANVECHAVAQPLENYQGQYEGQTAEVIVRRRYLTRTSNDLGFKRGPDRVFRAIVSDVDQQVHTTAWFDRLTQRYAYHVAVTRLAEQGFELQSGTQEGGQIRLLLRRVA